MTDLIRTKFAPPRLRTSLVPRTSLLNRLDDALDRKLTLLSAPAGFGKTTLVNEWIASREASTRPRKSSISFWYHSPRTRGTVCLKQETFSCVDQNRHRLS